MDLNAIMISFIILVFLVILFVLFRKMVTLAMVRIMYGQFSYEFVHLYKKYYVRSPYQYCFRDEFITHFLFVVSKKPNIPSYKSPKDIYFENTPYFISYKDFLKKRGNPYCFNAFAFNEPDFVIKALGYQTTVAGSKAIIIFYFMNDSFFMGEYIFKNPKNDIKASLTNHFLEMKDISGENFYIENSKDRLVHFQNTGFTIDIKYLNRENKAIIENLNQYFNKVVGKKIVVES
jgi:hypothetical protein